MYIAERIKKRLRPEGVYWSDILEAQVFKEAEADRSKDQQPVILRLRPDQEVALDIGPAEHTYYLRRGASEPEPVMQRAESGFMGEVRRAHWFIAEEPKHEPGEKIIRLLSAPEEFHGIKVTPSRPTLAEPSLHLELTSLDYPFTLKAVEQAGKRTLRQRVANAIASFID